MTINARVLWRSIALAVLATGPLMPMASAGLLSSVSFTGTIGGTAGTASGNSVTVEGTTMWVNGDSISGTFTYAAPTTNPSSTGAYTLSGLTPAPTLTFTITTVASANEALWSGALNFSDKYASSSTAYAAQVTWASATSTTLALTGPMANTSVDFALSLVNTTGGGGYSTKNLTLPGTTTITSDFKPSASTITFSDFIGVNSENFSATLVTLEVLGAPEPSSLVIVSLTVAISALGYSVASWRKRRRAAGAPIA